MKKLSELQDFFYENIYPDLEQLELKRVEIYSSLKKIAIVQFVIMSIAFYYLFDAIPTVDLLMFEGAISVGLFGFIYKMKVSGYASLFKNQIIEKLVKFIGDSLRYNKLGYISETDYRFSSLFTQRVDRYSGDDLVVGKVDGVDIRFSEVHSEVKKKGNKGKTYWLTIFRGLFFVADFNKHFKGKTVILPDSSEKF